MPLSHDEVSAAFVSYQRPLLAFCAQRVGDATAAEDVAGEVWEDFLRAAPVYEDRGYSASALLFRIAHNRCVDYLRLQRRRPTVPLSDRLVAPAPDVDGALDMAMLLRRVAQRRPDYAAVLIAKAAGVTDVELAARLGISHGAVKALAHRARAAAQKASNHQTGDTMGYVEKDRPRRPKPAATPRPDRTEQAYLTQGGQGATCRVCGATLTFTFPMPLRAFADTLKAFGELHRGCTRRPQEGSHGQA